LESACAELERANTNPLQKRERACAKKMAEALPPLGKKEGRRKREGEKNLSPLGDQPGCAWERIVSSEEGRRGDFVREEEKTDY